MFLWTERYIYFYRKEKAGYKDLEERTEIYVYENIRNKLRHKAREGGKWKKRSRYPCRAETSKASMPFSLCLSRCFSLSLSSLCVYVCVFFPTLHVNDL